MDNGLVVTTGYWAGEKGEANGVKRVKYSGEAGEAWE